MAIERFTKQQLNAYLESIKDQYDGVRLVNPYECRIFSIARDGGVKIGPYCYSVWNIADRCKNCISLESVESGAELDKDEVKDGTIYHIHAKPAEILDPDGSSYTCVIEMITIEPKADASKHVQQDRRVTREKFADSLTYVIQNMHSGIACFNLSGQCIYANAEVFRMFECEDDLDKIQNVLEQWLQPQGAEDTWKQKFNASSGTREYVVQKYPLQDALNKQIGYYYFFFDRTDEGKQFDVERFRATHDEMTQVYNRFGFYGAVRDMLEQDPDGSYLMLASNIRDFRLFNELFGVQKGNEILIKIAELIRASIQDKEHAIAGRLQGDRFALLIREDEFNPDRLFNGMNAISSEFANDSFSVRNHTGIYRIKDRTTPVAIMCDRASIATKAIQNKGENAWAWYDNEMMEHALHDLSVINEFHDALKEGQFQIYLQPQISCDEKLVGAEALCRWIHPEKGIIMPGDFIRILEDYGQIHQLDYRVWELAVQLLKKWEDTPLSSLFLTVNISVKDFFYLDLYETFTSLVGKYGVPPRKLKLEITESVFMSDATKTIELIERLQSFGFEVEIDDFGSGYSSLNLLKDLSADVLKIDMGFLRETENKSRSRTILNAVISMSKGLGMPVVSEGVETKAQVEYLRNIGCDIFQGYFYSKPIPISEFEQKYFPGVTFQE
ncbi:MAG: GGDEF domain-containing protein [Solobacterium sp.]|nr:GGDEF domain-containing protein [Solobacterium sp.]